MSSWTSAQFANVSGVCLSVPVYVCLSMCLSFCVFLCLCVDFACSPGEFLDISTDQECHACPAGTFSLGGGVLFKDWTQLPAGFTASLYSFSTTQQSESIETHHQCDGYTTADIYKVFQKMDPLISFCDNFYKCISILSIFLLLQQEIHNA